MEDYLRIWLHSNLALGSLMPPFDLTTLTLCWAYEQYADAYNIKRLKKGAHMQSKEEYFVGFQELVNEAHLLETTSYPSINRILVISSREDSKSNDFLIVLDFLTEEQKNMSGEI